MIGRERWDRQIAPYSQWTFVSNQNQKKNKSQVLINATSSCCGENESSSEHWTRKKYIWNGIFVFMVISFFGFCFVCFFPPPSLTRPQISILWPDGSDNTSAHQFQLCHIHMALSIIHINCILLFRAVSKLGCCWWWRLLLTRACFDNINRIKQPEQIYLTFLDFGYGFFAFCFTCATIKCQQRRSCYFAPAWNSFQPQWQMPRMDMNVSTLQILKEIYLRKIGRVTNAGHWIAELKTNTINIQHLHF